MKRLLYFIYKHNAVIVFALLVYASGLLIAHQPYHTPSALHVIGCLQNWMHTIKTYPTLKVANAELLLENAALREKILQVPIADEQRSPAAQHHLIPAQVVNNTIVGTKNFLTLNKGTLHSIAPGMGVISNEGVVGKVQAVSPHFAVVISVLHTAMQISAQIERNKVLGTVQWPGKYPCSTRMLYVPRHVSIEIGDAVVTSGYNATFCAGILIGHVVQKKLRKESPFYDIVLSLSTDFSTLQHVYIMHNTLKEEKDALEEHYFYESSH